MLGRCSPESRAARFLGHRTTWPDAYVDGALAGDGRQIAAAVVDFRGRTVGLASVVPEGTAGEYGVIIEDDWQWKGVGTALTAAAFGRAQRAGLHVVTCTVGATNVVAVRLVVRVAARLRMPVRHEYGSGVLRCSVYTCATSGDQPELGHPRATGPVFGPTNCAIPGS